ncbi:MAG: hypothetical protein LBV33_01095, partial [Lachnospiraceae bacterium]|nr:hypothetical protein [Lachnospiraceae bacterium]
MKNSKCNGSDAYNVFNQYFVDHGDSETECTLPTIGENGNWFIGDDDSGVSAQGAQGEAGAVGPQGPKGDVGDIGPQGLKGDTGDIGP